MVVLRAFRTFPVESIFAGASLASAYRSNKLATNYYAKLKSRPSNLAYNATFHPRYGSYSKKEKRL